MGLIKQRWKVFLTIVTFIALAGLVYGVRHQIFDTISRLDEINAWVLLLMVPCQMLSYHGIANLYQDLLAILGIKADYRFMYRVGLEMTFINTVFPSGGVSGFSYFGMRLKNRGISVGKATLVQTMRFALVFISFQILLVVGLFILAIGGRANNLVILVAGSLATLLFMGTLTLMYIAGSERRLNAFFRFITQSINYIIHLVRPKHPETINLERVRRVFTEYHANYVILRERYKELKKPLFYALLANIAEIATIYIVYVAFGQWVNPGAVIIAYAIANFAGTISVLPGGIGIYEVLMTGVLATAGVPAGLSLPVTVMYRILNMLMQLPVGYAFYHKALSEQPANEEQRTMNKEQTKENNGH